MKDKAELSDGLDDFGGTDTLGPLIQQYGPFWVGATLLAVFGCTFLCSGGASFISGLPDIWGSDYQYLWLVLLFCFGLLFVLFGLVVIALAVWMSTYSVTLCEKGFCDQDFRRLRVFPWNSICSVREEEVHLYDSLKNLKNKVQPKIVRSFAITNAEGQVFRFGDRTMPRVKGMESALRTAARKYSFPWDCKERHEIDFGS
jgi:hypothetical protein